MGNCRQVEGRGQHQSSGMSKTETRQGVKAARGATWAKLGMGSLPGRFHQESSSKAESSHGRPENIQVTDVNWRDALLNHTLVVALSALQFM